MKRVFTERDVLRRAHRFARTLIGLALLGLPRLVCAQSSSTNDSAATSLRIAAADTTEWSAWTTACLDDTSRVKLAPALYALSAQMLDANAKSLQVQADLMAKEVAERIRLILGGTGDSIPTAKPPLNWRSAVNTLVVVVYRDGHITRSNGRVRADSSGRVLLRRAFDETRAEGGALLIWPDGYEADSAIVHLSLGPSNSVDVEAIRSHRTPALRFKTFTVGTPTERPALPTTHSLPRYPAFDRRVHVTGTLEMQFVVDTNGRALESGMRDLWPANTPRLTGTDSAYYAEFVSSVRTWLLQDMRFSPAMVGSCRSKQIVVLPISFAQPGHR